MSETDTSTIDGTDTSDADETEDDQSTDWEAEAKKWQELSRKNEARAKANSTAAKELEQLRQSQMSDTDKAVAEAKDTARREAGAEFGKRLAAAELKAALAGVVPDPDAIVEDLNLAKYVTDDGDVDADAVKALRAKYAAMKPGTGSADLKQGVRGKDTGDKPDNNQWLRDKVAGRR